MSLLQSQVAQTLGRVAAAVANEGSGDCSAWNKISPSIGQDNSNSTPAWLLYIIAVGLMLYGLSLAFAGYKNWPTSVFFVSGYVCAAMTEALIRSNQAGLGISKENIEWYAYGFGMLVFLVCGWFFSRHMKFASFLVGASTGVVGALFLQPLFLAYIWAENPNIILYIMVGVFGAAGGLLVYWLERPIVIIGTGFIGSFLFIYNLSAIVGGMPDFGSQVYNDISNDGIGCVPDAVWGYSGGLLVLTIVGSITQIVYTAKGIDHGNASQDEARTPEQEGYVSAQNKPGVQYV